MECEHSAVRSVNCKLYCIACGAELAPESVFGPKVGNDTTPAETASDGPKTPVKRGRKKTDE